MPGSTLPKTPLAYRSPTVERIRRPVLAAIDDRAVIEFAQEMLRIPSFTKEEQRLAEFLAGRLEGWGFKVEAPEVTPGRFNVVGRLPATGPGRSLIFNGHMDHNMVAEGWQHDPFGGVVEEGWLIGLGAVNMKGANAAMTMDAVALHRGQIPHGEIMVQHVVGELQGGVGTKALLARGYRADGFIVGEPSDLRIARQSVGVVQAAIRTRGEMMHFTAWRRGRVKRHAIEDLFAIVQALGESYVRIRPGGWLTFDPHPDFPDAPIMNVGVVKGGMTDTFLDWRPSLVPDRAMAIVDVRIVPGQTPESVRGDIERVIARVREDRRLLDAQVELLDFWMPPLNVSKDEAVVRSVAAAHQAVTGEEAVYEFKVGAGDASHLAAAGIPGIMYGPGGPFISIPDERLPVKEVLEACRVYALAASQFTSAESVQ